MGFLRAAQRKKTPLRGLDPFVEGRSSIDPRSILVVVVVVVVVGVVVVVVVASWIPKNPQDGLKERPRRS